MLPQSIMNINKPLKVAVLNPTAQTNKLCAVNKVQDSFGSSILSKIERLRHRDLVLFCIATLQLSGGLRISEVLNIMPSDITSIGHVVVKGSKGSSDRIIHAGNATTYLLRCRLNSTIPFYGYNRFFVYREYKKLGIEYQSANSKKKSVTHAFRQVMVESNRTEKVDSELISKQLGHKNEKNIKYYGKRKK